MKSIYTKSLLPALLLLAVQLYAQIPAVDAPTPTYPAADVTSLYSDTYTPFTALSVLNWGQTATLSYVETANGEAIKLTNLQWIAVGLSAGPNVSAKGYMHLDVYCNESTPFRLGLVQWGIAGNPATEVYTPYITLTPGQWYSIDYPISYFTSRTLDCKKIGAIRFGDDDGTKYSKEIYVDNIYFFTGTANNPYVQSALNDVNMESEIKVFPTTVADLMMLESQENIETASIVNLIGQTVKRFDVNGIKKELNLSNLSSGNYILNVKLSSGKYANKKIVKL